jgi:hypothetical protein
VLNNAFASVSNLSTSKSNGGEYSMMQREEAKIGRRRVPGPQWAVSDNTFQKRILPTAKTPHFVHFSNVNCPYQTEARLIIELLTDSLVGFQFDLCFYLSSLFSSSYVIYLSQITSSSPGFSTLNAVY